MDMNTFIPVTSVTSGKNFPVTTDVFCLPIQIVNIAAIGNPKEDKEWVLVDAGMPKSADTILKALEKHFGGEHPPKCIIITHGHFDHVGGLEELAKRWNVPVYCHPEEMPYLTGIRQYPPPDTGADSGLVAKMSRIFPRDPVNLGPSVVVTLPPDGSIPELPGWKWIHTPGHTPGHISLFRESDRFLIAGDLISNVKQESLVSVVLQSEELHELSGWKWIHTPGHTPGHISLFRESDRFLIAGDLISNVKQESLVSVVLQSEELHGPPSYFTPDWKTAWESIKKLAALRPHSLIPGHGRPISDEKLADELQKLADNFDKKEIPSSGMYANMSFNDDNWILADV
uniref:Metallo-beta-lactamase domain-containing protein n=1 Tax=Panagrolaimus sp. PS1159 TaxID=55785 RepID=A0AC35F392_9BILA